MEAGGVPPWREAGPGAAPAPRQQEAPPAAPPAGDGAAPQLQAAPAAAAGQNGVAAEATAPEATAPPPPPRLVVDRPPGRPQPMETSTTAVSLQWAPVSCTTLSAVPVAVEFVINYQLQMQQVGAGEAAALRGCTCSLSARLWERWSGAAYRLVSARSHAACLMALAGELCLPCACPVGAQPTWPPVMLQLSVLLCLACPQVDEKAGGGPFPDSWCAQYTGTASFVQVSSPGAR